MAKVDVITGFLGAGKTTFLTRYTAYLKSQGISFCVIENEFGKAGIDGEQLRGCGVKVKEISGGCVCCTLKVDLYLLLCQLSQEFDRVILEPSGLFCGDDFADIFQSAAANAPVEAGIWVGIADPTCTGLYNEEDLAVLQSELYYAGAVLLSKADLCDDDCLQQAKTQVLSLLPDPRPQLFTLPPSQEDFFDRLLQTGYVQRPHQRRIFDHAAMFQSGVLLPKQTLTLQQAQAAAAGLMACGQVLRVKGHAARTGGGTVYFNCTPGCISVTQTDAAASGAAVNVIGRNLDRGAMRTLLP